MRLPSMFLSALVALSVAGTASLHAGTEPVTEPAASPAWLTADPFEIPATLQAQIDAALAALPRITSITPWQVIPIGAAADVFVAPDVLFQVVGLDVQLPWVAAGQINAGALANLLGPKAGLINQISAVADPSGGGFKLGAYKWSHMTAPDFCSSETLYFMYFERTGALFVFRFDSSSEC